ncbi:integrase catalytic domain-containing protein [Herminiimonas contaminans]|uniref:Transposase family protein n=1 Tax=Herminiimonas contaminans TaxID=1111140 RepID=A0ABS0EY36_9BURK|nr:DDE-type integrase/transposase/recombinase [Herminiimonas contaminans]MBF8179770.1 transposase family protein [Herminiimonas contaminans]
MQPIEFKPIPNAALSAGMVIRFESTNRYLRLTHIFETGVFGMWVDVAERAYFARRPLWFAKAELKALLRDEGGEIGQFQLPFAFTGSIKDEASELKLNAAWEMIEPLVSLFEKEENLSARSFSSCIRRRAESLDVSKTTLYRLVIRFYYFGGVRKALLPLARGATPGLAGYKFQPTEGGTERIYKRRGRQSILAPELGVNEFVVDESDIEDMIRSYKAKLRTGPTYISHAHENYLANYFSKRHPERYRLYLKGETSEPVTVRQFRYYIHSSARLDADLIRNVRSHERNPGSLSSVRASGPGEVYEIDATGGRIHLVSSDDPSLVVGKPILYLLIDRWSRFVVSAYLSLKPASWEEVRYALLIAFTSREKRFASLGVDINDNRWPIGRFPAVLCPDRGSEFLSESMERSVAQDLRIEVTPLPPLCPDGKAIVERFIREIKRRMTASELKGVYAERPLDPRTKRIEKRAAVAAVHSLKDAYRAIIEIIDDHNNRPHTALRKLKILTQAGIAPQPRDAYMWGLENVTGLRTPPLRDGDYFRLLLGIDTASIARGVLRYKQRPYLPVNETAIEMARTSTSRAKSIKVRIDKTDPLEVFVETKFGEWAQFRLSVGAVKEIAGLTLDEEEALLGRTAMHWARADHESRVARLNNKRPADTGGSKKGIAAKTTVKKQKLDLQETRELRTLETAGMKESLTGGRKSSPPENSSHDSVKANWQELEERERLERLRVIQENRNKK